MNLLIDFGNTRLKWALDDAGLSAIRGTFAHAGAPLAAVLGSQWQALPRPDGIFVASVVDPARERELAEFARQRFGLAMQILRSPAAALGVRNAYAEPQRLGIDRFLAMVAAQARAPRVQVLASVGTALTVDALLADGEHLGGFIVPGPALMRQAVSAGTARVDAEDGRYRDWPNSTADGVVSGALQAAAGAIERFRTALARRSGSRVALIVSGGGSEELLPLLEDAEHGHDLVLHGLALWARQASIA